MPLNWKRTEDELPNHNQLVFVYHRQLVFIVCIYKKIEGQGIFIEVNQLCIYPLDYYTDDTRDWLSDNNTHSYHEVYIDYWVDFDEIVPGK